MNYYLGHVYTSNKKDAHELQIIKEGDTHKWWTSARLLLGLSEKEACGLHHKLNNITAIQQAGLTIENRRGANTIDGNVINVWGVPDDEQDDVSYLEALLDK